MKKPNSVKKGVKKDIVEVLQTATHLDELGCCFTRINGKVYCSIDWKGGEMKFPLYFIPQTRPKASVVKKIKR